MYTKLTRVALALTLLTMPAAITGCGGSGGSAESVQSATATPAPQLENFSVLDQTQKYLENYGTNTWNSELSKEIAENIRLKARESEADKFTFLEIADSIEKDDIQNVKKLFTKIGGVIPASVASRFPDPTPTPVPTVEPSAAGSDDVKNYIDTDQQFGAQVLTTAKLYLEKDSSQEFRDKALAVITNGLEWITEENQSKFEELAISIQKNERDNVQRLYDELLPQYSGAEPATVTATATPEPAAAADETIHLKGKSDQATDFFHLKSGIAIVEASDAGDSNFVVYLYDESGKSKDLIVNEIGPYKGKSLVVIPEDGKYLLKVESDGSWKADITQSIPDTIKSAPIKLSGKGNDVVFAKLQSKLTKFTSKHVGESNFVVKVNDSLLLVNEIGNYSGSTVENIEDEGVYVFAVTADGPWSINIE